MLTCTPGPDPADPSQQWSCNLLGTRTPGEPLTITAGSEQVEPADFIMRDSAPDTFHTFVERKSLMPPEVFAIAVALCAATSMAVVARQWCKISSDEHRRQGTFELLALEEIGTEC